MSVKPLINQLEMRFWTTVIPLMQTSRPVRKILPWLYKLTTLRPNRKMIVMIIGCCFTGASLGLLLGVLSQFI